MDRVAQHLHSVTAEVWSSFLGHPVIARSWDAPPLLRGAAVELAGAWRGTVGLQLTPELAQWAAAQMFAMPAAELDEELIADALGELANVVGGNLQRILPGPTRLSLPVVGPMEVAPCGVPITVVRLLSGDQPLDVVMFEHSPVISG